MTGEIRDDEGLPVPFTRIVRHSTEEWDYAAISDGDGYWSFKLNRLNEGLHSFVGINPPRLSYGEKFIQEGVANHVIISERAQQALTVRLQDLAGNPVVGHVHLVSDHFNTLPGELGNAYSAEQDLLTDGAGVIHFPAVNAGPVKVWGSSALLGNTEVYEFELTRQPEGEALDIALAFPQDELAQLFGRVYAPDGNALPPSGTVVQAVFNSGAGRVHATAQVSAAGWFRFEDLVQTADPRKVQLTAFHPELGHFSVSNLQLHQSLRFRHDMILRKTGNLLVDVIHADGTPADFAAVKLSFRQLSLPPEGSGEEADTKLISIEDQITPENQQIRFESIPTGPIFLQANTGNGLAGTRAYALPVQGGDLAITVRLEAASQITGIFLNDAEQPILNAEVQLREGAELLQQQLTGDTTPEEGRFSFPDLPMRTYNLLGVDPTSNLEGRATVTTSPYRPEVDVTLRLDPVADLEGMVFDQGSPVAGATVTLSKRGFTLYTGTDENGHYLFKNLPLGDYRLQAAKVSQPTRAVTQVTLTASEQAQVTDLHFERALGLTLRVIDAAGNPAPRTLVNVTSFEYGQSDFTDADGIVRFSHMPMGQYTASGGDAKTLAVLNDHFALTQADPDDTTKTVQFSGWGSISGVVANSLGLPLEQPVHVEFEWWEISRQTRRTSSTDASGYFRIGRIPLGQAIKFRAHDAVTREVATGQVVLEQHGQEEILNLTFRAYTHASGVVRYQDGTPAAYARVSIEDPIRREVSADALGHFFLEPVIAGDIRFHAVANDSPRKAKQMVSIAQDPLGGLIPATDLELVLGGIADVTGVVRYTNGDVVKSGTVRLTEPNGTSLMTAIFADGSYRFAHVPLGIYEVTSWDNVYAWQSPVHPLTLSEDGVAADLPLVFQESYSLYGQVLTESMELLPDTLVELWRADSDFRYTRIYSGTSNNQGHYNIDHVYEGYYQIKAYGPDLELVHTSSLAMTAGDRQQDIHLQERSWILGSIENDEGHIFPNGQVFLTQGNHEYRTTILADGSFRFDGLQPQPYELRYHLAGGWITGTTTGSLNRGVNAMVVVVGETATLSGQVIYQGSSNQGLVARIVRNGLQRELSLDASGQFTLDHVPVSSQGEPLCESLELVLFRGAFHKSVDLGCFSGETVLVPFYLDGSGPEIDFAANGDTIQALPFEFVFTLAEPDTGSEIDETRTRVWINGSLISGDFTTSQNLVRGSFNLFPEAAVRGSNQIQIEVFNTSNNSTRETFTFGAEQEGTMVVVDLRLAGAAQQGQVRYEQQAWFDSDADGRFVLQNMAAGTYAIKGKSGAFGSRNNVVVADKLTQFEQLQLASYAELRGLVLDPQGEPAAGATVRIGEHQETSDAQGRYIFDLLPLGQHHQLATRDSSIGYHKPPVLEVPQSILLDVDISMLLPGVLEGKVLADVTDEQSGLDGVEVTLAYPDSDFVASSYFPNRTVTTANGGVFSFGEVPGYTVQLTAFDANSQRVGSWQGLGPLNGETLHQNIALSPSGNLSGIATDSNGLAVEAASVVVADFWRNLHYQTTTAADGSFHLENLPFGSYTLMEIVHEPSAAFYYQNGSFIVDQTEQDLGTLQLTSNTPPTVIQLSMTDPLDPRLPMRTDWEIEAAFRLKRMTLDFDGVYQKEWLSESRNDGRVEFHQLPATLAPGPLNYSLEIEDYFGAVTTTTGQIQIVFDVTGPQITLIQPQANGTFDEGANVNILVTASDSNGVRDVAVRLNGETLDTRWLPPFNLSVVMPEVANAQAVTFEILATDNFGSQSTLPLTLQVLPITTVGGPQISMVSPLDGMSLPLFLPQGLSIPVLAGLHDPDGLDHFEIRLDGGILIDKTVTGTDAQINETILLPEAYRGLARITLDLAAFDLGGNSTTISLNLNNLNGTLITQDTLISAFDNSLDGSNLIISGATVTMDGSHHFENFTMVNGAVLTQSPTDVGQNIPANTHIVASGDIVIAPGTHIDLTGKGYPGLPIALGITSDNSSHGGVGSRNYDLDEIYGSAYQPILPGSQIGGGAIKLEVEGVLWHGGRITANPMEMDGLNRRLGSGGSIWLDAAAIRGDGEVNANGYYGPDGYLKTGSLYYEGSGGRIAVYGEIHQFSGSVSAFGGWAAGAGTVYYRTPDATKADGYADILRMADHPAKTLSNFTAVETPEVDQIQVVDQAIYHLVGQTPVSPMQVLDGGLANGSDMVDLSANPLDFSGSVLLRGSMTLGDVTTSPDLQLNLSRNIVFGTLDHQWGTITARDRITATQLFVAAGAHMQTPPGSYAVALELFADQMNIAGTVASRANGHNAPFVDAYPYAHGGTGEIAYGEATTYGSAYRPISQGSSATQIPNPVVPAGGALYLQFESLHLDGLLDTTPSEGSGGSILLQGTTLTGHGELAADGAQNINRASQRAAGGGRIAVLAADITGFSGTAHAFGTPGAVAESNGGAGTVFYRTDQWPLGKLLIDNNGTLTRSRSTPLVGLGTRSASTTTGDGPTIAGEAFPDSLVGLYLVVPGFAPDRIAANTDSELRTEDGESFPPLQPGDSFSAIHRLDILEVRGQANLFSIDPIHIHGSLLAEQGTVEAAIEMIDEVGTFTDGSLVLHEDPGYRELVLDNFQLTVNYPLDIESLSLHNGASLTYRANAIISTVLADNASLIAAVDATDSGLLAENITLINGASWTVADRRADGKAFPLNAKISGSLAVDSSSTITTSGADKVNDRDLPWASGTLTGDAHGGYGDWRGGSSDGTALGSFAYPTLPGNRNGGGSIHLDIADGSFQFHGRIQADGENNGSGGSIWIEAADFTGTGQISAKPGPGDPPAFGSNSGGGRIAIHYGGSDGFRQTMDFDLLAIQPLDDSYGVLEMAGAGTLFLKGPGQSHGELIVDQDAATYDIPEEMARRFRLTGMTGLDSVILGVGDDDPDPHIIRDFSWTDLPPGLAGLHVNFTVDSTPYQAMIESNTHNAIHLAAGSGVPSIIPLDTTLTFSLHLDKLILRNGAQLFFPGTVSVADFVYEGTELNSIWCRHIAGLPNPFTPNASHLRLILDEPDLAEMDFVLTDSNLYLDKAITLRDITLVRSKITHTPYSNGDLDSAPFEPATVVTARHITADSDSGFDVRDKSSASRDSQSQFNHGGIGNTQFDHTYGNLFRPQSHGNGTASGGRLQIAAESLDGGFYRADGSSGSAGSVWLDVNQLTGVISVSASRSGNGDGGGRVAIYYEDDTNANLSTHAFGDISAGTVYLRRKSENHGHLLIDNDGRTSANPFDNKTPIPTMPTSTLDASFTANYDAATQTTILTLPNLVITENFVDYHLVINSNTQQTYPVLDSFDGGGSAVFIVAGDLSQLQAGDVLQLGIWLLRLETCLICTLEPAHLLIMDPEPPVVDDVTIEPLAMGELEPDASFTATVTASDYFGAGLTGARITFAGQDQTLAGDSPYVFTLTAPAHLSGTNQTLVIEVTDAFGNVETDTHSLAIAGSEPDVPTALAHWTLDSAHTNGTSVMDRAGDNHARLIGGLHVPSGLVEAVLFDGVDDRIELPQNQELDSLNLQDYSLSLWYKPLSRPGATNETNRHTLLAQNGWDLGLSYKRAYLFRYEHPLSDGSRIIAETQNTFAVGGSYHVAVVVSRTEGFVKLYVNNILESTQSFAPGTASADRLDTPWQMGAVTFGSEGLRWFAHGELDEVAVWDRALSEADLTAIYQAEGSGIQSDYLAPDEVSGLTVVTTTDSLTYTWLPPSTSDLAGYQVWFNGDLVELAADQNQYQATDLPPNTHFSFVIATFDLQRNASNGVSLGAVTRTGPGVPSALAWWTFDQADATASQVLDRAGPRHGTRHGGVLEASNLGDALMLNGIDEQVIWPHEPAMDAIGQGDYTISLWYKPLAEPGDTETTNRHGLMVQTGYYNGLFFRNNRKFRMVHTLADTTRFNVESGGAFAIDSFHHVAAVISSTEGYVRLFVNNLLVAEQSFTPGTPGKAWPDKVWRLGAASFGSAPDRWFAHGVFDEAAIWNRALSPAEIDALYQAELAGVQPDYQPPEEITDLMVTPSTTSLTFAWTLSANAAGDLAGYRVVFNGVPQPDLEPHRNSLLLTGLAQGSWEIRIAAFDTHGNQSQGVVLTGVLDHEDPVINQVSITPLPANDQVQAGAFMAVSVDATDNVAIAYVEAAFGSTIFTQAATPFQFDFLVPHTVGVPVELQVTVVDSAGRSTSQNQSLTVIDTQPPDEITDLNATAYIYRIDFTWDLPLEQAQDLGGYRVYFDDAVIPVTLAAQATAYSVAGLTPATSYPVRITAFDTNGNESAGVSITTATSPASEIPTAAAHFPLDADTVTADLIMDTASDRHGDRHGGQLQVSTLGGSLELNGIDQQAVWPHDPLLDNLESGDFSIALWYQPLATPGSGETTNRHALLGKDGTYSGLFFRLNRKFRLTHFLDDGTVLNLESPSAYPLNTNHHVVAVINAGVGAAKLYVNNQLVAEQTFTAGLAGRLRPDLWRLGAANYGSAPTRWFAEGIFDEVTLWNTAINAAHVDMLYQSGEAGMQMDHTPPTDVSDLRVTTSSDQLQFDWTPPENADGDLQGYRITFNGEVLPSVAADQWSYTATGLDPETLYDFAITAFDEDQNHSPGLQTSAVTRTVAETILPIPAALSRWSLDDSDLVGTQVLDAIASHHGTLQDGTSGQNGRFAQGFLFDGIDDHITLPNSTSLDLLQAGSFTLAVWFNPSAYPANTNAVDAAFALLMKQGRHLGLSYEAFGHFSLTHYLSDDSLIHATAPDRAVPGRFYQVVGVVDGIAGKASLYLDGKLVRQIDFLPLGSWSYGSQLWHIGAAGNDGTVLWPAAGVFDEIAIWDLALSPEEVALYFHREVAGKTKQGSSGKASQGGRR